MIDTPPNGTSAGHPSEELVLDGDTDNSTGRFSFSRPQLSLPRNMRRIELSHASELLRRLRAIRGDKQVYTLEQMRIEIRVLSRLLQPVISFTNGMGGASKSTTALYFGNIHSDTTRRTTILLPTTSMAEMASGGMYAGIQPEDDPLDILRFAKLCEKYESYWAISPDIPVTPYGLHVISEPFDEDVDIDFEFRTGEYVKVFNSARSASDAMMLDHGNDGIRMGSIVLEAIHRSHVVVFTATADNQKTLQKLSQIIRTYANDKTQPATSDDTSLVRDPRQISTETKVLNSIIVISKAGRGQNSDSFRRYIDVPNFKGTILTIPKDSYIEGDVVSRLEQLNSRTLKAYTYAHLMTLRKGAELCGIDLSMLDPVEEPSTIS